MADRKRQGHLNGAYDGRPPVHPPPHYAFRSPLCNLFKFLVALVITLGVVVLVLWFVFRPTQLKARVDTASLVQFDFDNSSAALHYNLSLDLTVRNPNRRVSLYYDHLEASAEYAGDRFGFVNLPAFYQRRKNTTVIGPILFDGTQLLLGEPDSVGETFRRERSEGFYYIDVKLRAKMRVKYWILKLRYNNPHINCALKLPVPGTTSAFESTDCHVHIFGVHV